MSSDKKPQKPSAPVEEEPEEEEKPKEVDILELLYSDEAELERVQTLELESVTMQTIARELRMRLDKHLQSQSRIISHLDLEITKKDARIEDLTEQKEQLEHVKAIMKKKNEDDQEQQAAAHEDQSKELTNHIQELRMEFQGMQELLQNKLQLEEELKDVVIELEKEKRDHTVLVGELERRNVMEKERLKYEMLRKIRETKLSLLAMTEDQLHTTTKRTIMENEQMTTELQYQSKETERIVKLNSKLLKENKGMRRQIELHEQSQAMLVKRAKHFQTSIKQLNDDLSKHKKDNVLSRSLQYSADPTQALIETKEIMGQLEMRCDDLEELVRAAREDTELARIQLEDTRRATARMLGVQNESLSFTLMCTEYVKLKFAEARLGTGPPIAGIAPDDDDWQGGMFPPINRSLSGKDGGGGDGGGGGGGLSMGTLVKKVMPSDFDLSQLDSPDHREAFLDLLIHRFNDFGPDQLALVTNV